MKLEEKIKFHGFISIDVWTTPKLKWIQGSILLRDYEVRDGCLWLKIDVTDKESNFGKLGSCQIRLTLPQRYTELILKELKKEIELR